jgi:hypothetical protein
MRNFKVGDIVEYSYDGSIYLISHVDTDTAICWLLVECSGVNKWPNPQPFKFSDLKFMGTSNAPEDQTPHSESTSSPALDTRT